METFYSVSQLARMTGRTHQRLYQIIKALEIERVPVGDSGHFVISPEDAKRVLTYLATVRLGRPESKAS